MEAPPLRSFYRISDCSYPKPKLAGATKAVCLDNFLSVFAGSPVTVLADNCDAATLGLLDDLLSQGRVAEVVRTSFGNAGAFRRAMELACGVEDPATPVYLAEDDYLHLRGSPQLIREGLACAQYVTLYDHPDKYRAEYDGGEVSKVVRTRSSHWRFTVSTCMTFATTAGQLRQDADVWLKWTEGPHPFDHKAFAELRERGRRLAVCIPGAACHTDLTYSRMIGDYAVEDWAAGLINGASAGRGDGPAAACGTRGYRAAACAPASADEHESIERLVRESLVIAAGQVEDELLPFAHFVRHVVRPANVLEIGTDVGGLFHVLHHLCAGKCLSVSLPGGPWGSLSLRGGVRRALELTLRYPRAHVVVGDSHDPESLALLRDMLGGESLDLLFIDGDHTEEGVLEDFRTYAPLVRPGGWICLHDIKESQFHRRHGCFVSDAWKRLRGVRCTFVGAGEWGGIGALRAGADPADLLDPGGSIQSGLP